MDDECVYISVYIELRDTFIGLPNREYTVDRQPLFRSGSRRRWLRLRFGLYSVADQLDSVLDELGMARHDDLEG